MHSLPPSSKHIIVEQTGCVDKDYYPIYDDNQYADAMSIDESEKQQNTFLSISNDSDNKQTLLIKSEIVTLKEKANCSIIFNARKELEIGDEIQFKRRNNNNLWSMNSTHSQINEGKGIVIDYNEWTMICTVSTNKVNNHCINIHCDEYEIIRLKSKNQSKLFKIITCSKQDLFTEFLENILPNQPTIILSQISSFLYNQYLRNVYFDCKSFEKLVQLKYDENNNSKPCSLCTMLNPLENKQCIICNHPFNDNDNNKNNNHWLGHDSCYEQKIYQIFKREQLKFPDGKQRHEMYAEKPYLPIILRTERININTIQKRLKMVLKPTTNLYKYQLHTVLWCYIREKSISSQQRLCIGSNDYLFTNRVQCGVYVINHKDFIPSNIKHIIPQRLLTYKGGIIADDVGLGKSLQMLSLIAVNTNNDDNNNNNNDIKIEYGPNKKSIRSAATLLIAPSHLINQWEHEIIKHFKKDILKIVIITTSSQHNKVSYADILSAEIVLISSQFIAGTHYKFMRMGPNNYLMQKHRNCLHLQLKIRTTRSRSRSTAQKPKHQDLNQKNIFFELIYWKRIILDEAPDYLCNDQIRDVIFSINAEYKWYVSATPFPNNQCIGHCADFLEINNDDSDIDWDQNINNSMGHILHCIIYNHLFSRHTKQSILDDNYLPNIAESVQYADFHPIEKLFYEITQSRRNTKKEDLKLERKICSGVLSVFERNQCDASYNNDYNNYLNDLLTINKEYYPLEIKRIENELKEEEYKLIKLKKYEKALEIKKNEFAEKGKAFKLNVAYPTQRERAKYQGIKQRVRSSEKRINEMELEIVRNKNEHKMVKNEKINKDIKKFEKEFSNKMDGKILLQIVKKYGVKQAVLLEFIKTLHDDINNRIIIFSLFGAMLTQIQSRLSQIGVYAVLCRGNIHSRKKALASFQITDNNKNNGDNKERRVILLSVENAASGANLNKATHVVLVDPVPGTSSEAFAKERQAVGRAVRQGMTQKNCTKVIRFVIRNTIEQETFERNQKLRKESMENNGDLNKSLKMKRRKSEIDFYIKINENAESENDENIDNGNVVVMKERKKSRKRDRKILDNDDNEEALIKKEYIENICEPSKKRRRKMNTKSQSK